jgi:CPA2 family monovalent cation:H+ antiporter-2
LIVTLQLAVVLLLGFPIMAIVQPFYSGPWVAIGYGVMLAMLGVVFWRRAANLHGHVQAGTEMIVELLAKQTWSDTPNTPAVESLLSELREMLPGFGTPVSVRVGKNSAAAGKSLAQLNLRGVTGATVLAIVRQGQNLTIPSAQQAFQGGDLVALAGTHDAIEAARTLLSDPPAKA